LIGQASRDALQTSRDPLQFDFWSEQHMDMIGHHHEGMQVISVEFGIAEFEAVADALGDASIFEPQRACLGAIHVLVG
jgi:hypothetical protein